MNKTQIVFSLAVAAVGLVLGALWGTQQDPGYEVVHVVALDEALRTDPSAAGPRTAAFIATMNTAASRDRAAAATGLPASAFDGIFAARVDDSPLVSVTARAEDPSGLEDRTAALIEATILNLIDQERAIDGTIAGDTTAEIGQLEDQLHDIASGIGLVGDTDLEQLIESDAFALASAEAQLASLPEDEEYWSVRLPGDIVAYQQRIVAVEAVLEPWIEARERLNELVDLAGPSTERLRELDTAEEVTRSGVTVLRGEPSLRSARIVTGRWAAVGAGLGLAGAFAFLGASSLHQKRPARATRAEGSASAPAAS